MKKERYVKALLTLIALLLALNIVTSSSHFWSTASAQEPITPQKVDFRPYINSASGYVSSTITCSSDGKYVYAVDGQAIYRSSNYGEAGSWEKVAE